MQIRAAIVWQQGIPLAVETAELSPPGPGEVLVEMQAAGVCHSDLHAVNGDWPMRVPLIPGHEGAGIVREVGPDVTRLRLGDRVVLCWAPACGVCPSCAEGRPVLCERLDKTTFRNRMPDGSTRLRAQGKEVAPFLGTACFASHVVVPEEGAVAIGSTVRFELLASVGCAVITGVGAVMNAAKVPEGATVAVLGAGGVGLNVVQGARLAQASRIIAVDRNERPLALAVALGATEIAHVSGNAADAVRAVTSGRGADYVFDTIGSAETIVDALAAARRGGTVVITGLSRVDGRALIATFPFVMHEKRLIGSAYGSGQPLKDIPRLISLYEQGQLKLEEVTTRTYPLDQINDALGALSAGEGGRGIIRF